MENHYHKAPSLHSLKPSSKCIKNFEICALSLSPPSGLTDCLSYHRLLHLRSTGMTNRLCASDAALLKNCYEGSSSLVECGAVGCWAGSSCCGAIGLLRGRACLAAVGSQYGGDGREISRTRGNLQFLRTQPNTSLLTPVLSDLSCPLSKFPFLSFKQDAQQAIQRQTWYIPFPSSCLDRKPLGRRAAK